MGFYEIVYQIYTLAPVAGWNFMVTPEVIRTEPKWYIYV